MANQAAQKKENKESKAVELDLAAEATKALGTDIGAHVDPKATPFDAKAKPTGERV